MVNKFSNFTELETTFQNTCVDSYLNYVCQNINFIENCCLQFHTIKIIEMVEAPTKHFKNENVRHTES